MFRKGRSSNAGLSVAFIDVMSCGLGAVILLFFLVDFEEGSSIFDTLSGEIVSEQTSSDKLNAISTQLDNEVTILREQVDVLVKMVSSETVEVTKLSIKEKQLSVTSENLKKSVESLQPKEAVKAEKKSSDNGNLVGLKISGRRILILMDTSASMAFEKIVDVIVGVSDKTGDRLFNGDKWLRARKTTLWILDRIPAGSEVQVIGFAHKVKPYTQQWISASDQRGISQLKDQISKARPNGGTSLGLALEHVAKLSPLPSTIYTITDGLPTKPGNNSRGINTAKNCFSIGSKQRYVDGACRESLFVDAVTDASKAYSILTNVILLPLEGDPYAAPLYWRWSRSTGGTLFSPAPGWPQ
ncbi:MAG: vWA domain-containing protein [Oceanicoccus sp.]